jgi:hypothetical protein
MGSARQAGLDKPTCLFEAKNLIRSEFIKFLVGQDKGEGEDTGDKEV